MDRPDEKLFLQHIEHFQAVDEYLEDFCEGNNFELDRNLHRTPCRVLRKSGNPKFIIDFYQDGNWLKLEPENDLPHTFVVGGYYESATDNRYVYKLEYFLAKQKTFSEISEKLPEYLIRGLEIFDLWTPEIFEKEGNIIRKP